MTSRDTGGNGAARKPAGRNAKTRAVRVVAFGGGHGLSATLRALRIVQRGRPVDITAVVTVADDGGSSGRLRRTRDILPPGDLRQALAAVGIDAESVSNDTPAHIKAVYTDHAFDITVGPPVYRGDPPIPGVRSEAVLGSACRGRGRSRPGPTRRPPRRDRRCS